MVKELEVDAEGRLRLPQELRKAARIEAPGKVRVRIRPDGLLLCSQVGDLPKQVAEFAALDGPVDDWDALEADIGAEHQGKAQR